MLGIYRFQNYFIGGYFSVIIREYRKHGTLRITCYPAPERREDGSTGQRPSPVSCDRSCGQMKAVPRFSGPKSSGHFPAREKVIKCFRVLWEYRRVIHGLRSSEAEPASRHPARRWRMRMSQPYSYRSNIPTSLLRTWSSHRYHFQCLNAKKKKILTLPSHQAMASQSR